MKDPNAEARVPAPARLSPETLAAVPRRNPPAPRTPATVPVARFIPSGEATRLVFGPKFFAHLGAKALTVYEEATLSKVATVPLKGPRGVGALADGGVVALDEAAPGEVVVVHVSARKATKRYPAVVSTTSQGLSRVLGDPRAAGDFWVLSPGAQVSLEGLRLTMVAGALETTDAQELPTSAARTLTAVADGLIYYEAPSLRRVGAAGRPGASYLLPEGVGALYHLAPGTAPGTLVAADDRGRVHWLKLEGAAVALTHTVDTGAVVYGLDGGAPGVAALLVEDHPGREATWTAVVWDGAGKELLRLPVPWLPRSPPGAGDTVRLSATHLAVGGLDRFVVWERSNHKQKLALGL